MASSWGTSWGSAWGSSWGGVSPAPAVSTATPGFRRPFILRSKFEREDVPVTLPDPLPVVVQKRPRIDYAAESATLAAKIAEARAAAAEYRAQIEAITHAQEAAEQRQQADAIRAELLAQYAAAEQAVAFAREQEAQYLAEMELLDVAYLATLALFMRIQ